MPQAQEEGAVAMGPSVDPVVENPPVVSPPVVNPPVEHLPVGSPCVVVPAVVDAAIADRALVDAARAGDRDALERLWASQRSYVAVVLMALRPRGQDLEDLLQEVALIFTERLNELRDPGALRGWLRTVARNVVHECARRSAARSPTPLRDDVADPRAERSVSEPAESREEFTRVLDAIASLPTDYREALLLRSVDGMSQRQVASLLGVPETTIETRLARGRRLLRERLRPAPTAPVECAARPLAARVADDARSSSKLDCAMNMNPSAGNEAP